MNSSAATLPGFTNYQKFVVGLLAFLQFTIILDFMILSPLGAILIPTLQISPSEFGLVVSAYAFSAGASGFLAAGFADRFDRKKLLLFFYSGFVLGTFLCGIATNYRFLLGARMITGVFGGVIGSIVFAITTDLFPFSMRGRVMGVVQTAFSASQVLGIPVGLYLSNLWGWHAPFLLIVGVSIGVGMLIFVYLRPITEHLKIKSDKNPFHHFIHTFSVPRYLQGFATTALLSTGGFMLMPFSSAFSVHNLGIPLDKLPMVYIITGLSSIVAGPIVGRLSDRLGKFMVFLAGSILTIICVIIYTHLSVTPIAEVIFITAFMMIGVSSRMISSSAIISGVPDPADRGAYMSVSSSIQQVSGGIASAIAGLIIIQGANGTLERFDVLGYVIVGATTISVILMYFIYQYVETRVKGR